MGCTMTLIKLPPRNLGMHLLSNVSAIAFKHIVIGMRIIVVVVVAVVVVVVVLLVFQVVGGCSFQSVPQVVVVVRTVVGVVALVVVVLVVVFVVVVVVVAVVVPQNSIALRVLWVMGFESSFSYYSTYSGLFPSHSQVYPQMVLAPVVPLHSSDQKEAEHQAPLPCLAYY